LGIHLGRKKNKELWLCLRFTHLSLNSLGIAVNSSPALAVSYQKKVWQCNQHAHRSGIKIGMAISQALALDSGLVLYPREPETENQKYQNLSHWAYRFSALVSAYTAGCLMLEIGKSLKLFNSLETIVNAIKGELDAFQITAKTGLGKTPKAAYAMSFGDSSNATLENCALAHLELSPNTLKQLQLCGFEFLSDIANIAQAELGQRFGVDLLTYLKQLYGDLADPQAGITPPETFHACVDFAEPIYNRLWIQPQLDKLLADLSSFLYKRQWLCHQFSWRFSHASNGGIKKVDVTLSANQNKLATLYELSELTLSNTQLEWAFSSIELISTELTPIQLFNDDLFNPQANQAPFKQLVDRLSSRLGHSAIFGIHNEPEQLPELANARHTVQEQKPALYANVVLDADKTPLETFAQPLCLLDSPKKLTQQAKQPYLEGPLSIIHGPDRISSHWWETLQSRDYFIARQRSGRLLWVFYDRVQQNWFLHGLFA